MRKPARVARFPLRAALSLVVAAFLAVAASAAGGEPAIPTTIPDSAFGPVTLLPGSSAPAAAARPQRTADLNAVRDPWVASAPPERAQPPLPDANPIVVPVATPKPAATTQRISGTASWYCRSGSSPCTSGYPDGTGVDAYAAAGPRLRAALGASWRGMVVTVDGIRVKLIDWCQCYQGEPNEKLLDLYYDVFARTGSSVTVRW
jgi:hypothetical protein